jgi:alkylresorcinol/alkylpyrone synthase
VSKILDVATALPAHRFKQAEILEISREFFGPLLAGPRRAEIFERAGVDTRCLVEPKKYYLDKNDFETKNRDYLKHALELAEACTRACLKKTGQDFTDVDHIICVTTTGLLTPSLEARLAQVLPFKRTVKRTPLFGSGCAGGAVALARAQDYLEGHPRETVLALSVELCSLTLMPTERTMIQVVAAALFGDGASAVLLAGNDSPRQARAEILACESILLPDSLDIMGWDFTSAGMKLVLSKRAPELIEAHFKSAVVGFLEKHGVRLSDMRRVLLHPGSGKILDACERALGLAPELTALSRRFLAENGNLSSSSLLFILRDALEQAPPPPGSLGLMAAFGPGFACELLLIRFA